MGTFCKVATGAGLGATAGTFGSVGTVQCRNDVKEVLGVYVLAAGTTGTTAEAESWMIELKSDDWDVGTIYFSLGGVGTHGVATNSESFIVHTGFKALKISVKAAARIAIGISGTNSNTDGCDCVVGILYSNGGVPQEALTAIWNWGQLWSRAGKIQVLADGKATARTQLSTWPGSSMQVNGSVITGIKVLGMSDSIPTADESAVGYVDFETSIANFAPQEYPWAIGLSASDGTAPLGSSTGIVKSYPCWIPMANRNETIDAYSQCKVASSGAIHIVAGIEYR